MVSCAHSLLHASALDTDPYTAQQANEPCIQTAAVDVTAFVMGKLHLLDTLIRRILPVRLAAPDAYYPNPQISPDCSSPSVLFFNFYSNRLFSVLFHAVY